MKEGMRELSYKLLRIVGAYLALSFVFGLIALAQIYPVVPSTPRQWLGLFLLSLPVWLAAQAYGHFLWKNRFARFVDEATEAESFSFVRVAYGIAAILLSISAVAGAFYGWEMLHSLLEN